MRNFIWLVFLFYFGYKNNKNIFVFPTRKYINNLLITNNLNFFQKLTPKINTEPVDLATDFALWKHIG